MADDLEEMSLGDFIVRLDKREALGLSDKEVQAAVSDLEEQWFEKAAELRSLDAEAFKFLPNIPSSLATAILRQFHPDDFAAQAPQAIESVKIGMGASDRNGLDSSDDDDYRNNNNDDDPYGDDSGSADGDGDDSKMDEAENAGLAALGNGNLTDDAQKLEAVVQKLCAESADNHFVMLGLTKMLKRGIEDANDDSAGGRMKQKLLRTYLRKVNEVTKQATLRGAIDPSSPEYQSFAQQELGAAEEERKRADSLKRGGSSVLSVGTCGLCKGARQDVDPSADQLTLDCSHDFHPECLHDFIMDLVGQKRVAGMQCPHSSCSAEINVSHIQQALDGDEFNQYLEATLMAFVEQDNLTFVCPSDKCDAIISLQPYQPQPVPDIITERDPDGNVLSAAAWQHFQEFRMRCRQCNTIFCSDCKAIPYHKGHTCAEWKQYQSARHCRFCDMKIGPKNTAPNPPSITLRDVCTEEECVEKRDNCCTEQLPCGCPCNGVRDEAKDGVCLPCLKCELETADEYCSICYVESLAEAPCIQLNACSHVFHFHCIKNKLAARWPGARVSFDFLNCPLCSQVIEHSSLEKEMAPINALRKEIQVKALDRLKYEGRMKDKAIVEAGGPYHNDPVKYAMHEYLFYICHQCKKPYFAGGYQCQEANAPFNPEELICPSCQPSSVDDCPVHGKDWLAFKCRYCCNYANWYCWGKTHFCDHCHKSGVWQKLAEFRTGKNKKRIWEYDQCAGIKAQLPKIVNDNSLSITEKEALCEKIMCDPTKCPLKIAHPPNGFEYGLGCSMCEDKKNAHLNEEAARKAKEEEEAKRRELDSVRQSLRQSPNGRTFLYKNDNDRNGVFHFLGTVGGTRSWKNPCEAGFVKITSSGLMGDSEPLSAVVGYDVVRCVTKPVRNSWIAWDLVDFSLQLTHYKLRHYSSWDTECLRNWVLEGSNDGVKWELLAMHKNDTSLNKKGAMHTWRVNHPGRFRQFRIIQTGVNSNNHYYLALSGSEFYGVLHPDVPASDVDEKDDAPVNAKRFHYDHDFDENGVLYYLGTNCGASPVWMNPALLGQVNVTSSPLASKPPSVPAHAIVGRNIVRCVTVARPNMWFMIDLKDKKLNVTHYTLRHYNSWDTECLRNWRFEASNDGQVWTPLRVHRNDEGLNGKGSTFTWPIENAEQRGSFSMFRILQTDKNSNNHHYLACSGVELYGTMTQTPPVAIPAQGVQLNYTYDFDGNGLFYYLGTRGKRKPWRNPAQAGLVVCSAAKMASNPPSEPPHAIVGRSLVRCVTAARPDMWFKVDLKDKRILPTHYTLRHYNSWDTEALRNWRLEGSNDDASWTILREHKDDKALDRKGATYTWQLPPINRVFRYLRLYQTGLNSNNHHYLACSGFEVYGTLFDAAAINPNVHGASGGGAVAGGSAGMGGRMALAGGGMAGAVMRQPLPMRDGLQFRYESDFDQNGILYWLGTRKFTAPWRNPAETGIIEVRSSPLASQSMPAWAAAGRECVRCVTVPKKGTWFEFDLKGLYVIPTAYTLRHYSSWDTEALTQWKFEGSIDGKKWKTLTQHKKDKSLTHKGATATWVVKGISKSYSMFRILQTGKNSNKHWYLALSGFELYGTVWSFRKK
eukprot:TRINITY_DN67395_c8_g1_i1.p1 TRINITY_DN67395_c8_g1~~TRINITY_DN67395_c8_g1_i1.p1  ORF type:complete len:1605 (+),score=973.64 TRINITY_DN67395_c8_g1_i1:233-5047(+)